MILEAENKLAQHVYVPLFRDSSQHHPVPLLVTGVLYGFYCVEMPLPSDPEKKITNWYKIESCKEV